ncbi:hypothetical protein O7634_26490 [Micromonospora sp. WMMD1120]|uniref:hypothetical protein n=1 Tax=Micromonospora sp. WMMD1120 TaxID=3016106 RepID=UPI002416F346|nr:hypothetical protein [Micromonospora sp. WMMD1120]MDG4810317.1 hypothetical protein [Micromonospora sp. WMMD1120]
MGLWSRALAASTAVLIAGCTTANSDAATPSSGATASPAGCATRVETGALPDWADAGFHGDTRPPHVFGAKGDIVAVLFAHPLRVTRTDGSNNKILWVARATTASSDPAAPATLVITATRDGTDTTVTREVAGGPGPSIIDLPEAGCWRLNLRWSGHTDTINLTYAP